MLRLDHKRLPKIHILPNAITYVNMALGAIAIFVGVNNTPYNIKAASTLILIAGVLDKLDGYVARKLGATSHFGKELDSLCDLVSFGIAPVILWWHINKGLLGIGEVLVSLFFIGGGIFRLARYNISKEKSYIVGLPITIAGMVMAGKHFLDISYRMNFIDKSRVNIENILIICILSIGMISSFKINKKFLRTFLN